jgi:predicted acylesterase/phospholipase RssA
VFDAVAFAGGGNRCYWQNGVWRAVADRIDLKPRLVVGASAGACQAVLALLGQGERAHDLVVDALSRGIPNIDWSRRRHTSGALFPVGAMYRDLVAEVIDDAAFHRLQSTTDLRIAVSRPPRMLPGVLAPAIGVAAYQIEKKLFHPVHPRFGRALGFRADYLAVRDMMSASHLVDAVMASSTVPPFMPAIAIGGRRALDAGLYDNVPTDPLREIEAAGGRTLVLLSRPYRILPQVPGRTYWQPSEPIYVGQFDIENPEGIRFACALGLRDGARFAQDLVARRSSAS